MPLCSSAAPTLSGLEASLSALGAGSNGIVTGALMSPSFEVSPPQAPWPFSILPFLYSLFASFYFYILHQCLDSVARRAIQCDSLVAGRAHRLRPWRTLSGNAHLKHFVNGLPETVEVVVYQSWGEKKIHTLGIQQRFKKRKEKGKKTKFLLTSLYLTACVFHVPQNKITSTWYKK